MDSVYSFEKLVQAYFDCRRHKRGTASALRFEQNLESNLMALHEALADGSYRPGRSICFAISRPRPREVWAASFHDRIVHHLMFNEIADRYHRRFIADSCACIAGRGTLYAAKRLESKVRSQTQNWRQPGFYLKADLANFFVSIDKRVLWPLLARHIPDPWWRGLTRMILFHDPRDDYIVRGDRQALDAVPQHKRLTNAGRHFGLPIGNLSSQFFANVLLNELDQHVKHQIGARHYTRYVDDMVLLHESTQWLRGALDQIETFLPGLGLQLNPRKTIIQPISRGIDYVGQLIKPHRRITRRRTLNEAVRRLECLPTEDLFATGNSYLGLARQASHGHADQARIARVLRRRGLVIAGDLGKTLRPTRPAEGPFLPERSEHAISDS